MPYGIQDPELYSLILILYHYTSRLVAPGNEWNLQINLHSKFSFINFKKKVMISTSPLLAMLLKKVAFLLWLKAFTPFITLT